MHKNTLTLETQRLRLRRFRETDAYAVYEIFSDKEVNTFLPFFVIPTLEEAKRFLKQNYIDSYQREQGYKYAICLKEDDVPIGYICVSMKEGHDFGYGLRKEAWHKGIASEAGRAVIKQLKKDGMPYITATHDIRNPRSGEVMKRLGMHYQYSYEEQWQPKNIPVIFRMYQLNLDGDLHRVYRSYWEMSKHPFVENDV